MAQTIDNSQTSIAIGTIKKKYCRIFFWQNCSTLTAQIEIILMKVEKMSFENCKEI